ncbi:response regulator with CheY-like receiver domain and winged-helix DNA-binding domain protein [Rheinheimera sp. A13L]|uniref:response regulator transcription factor n=1 Tax=Rheinheimera sp. A13L TaxID=506534 RepID=UPI00021248A9|nr:response regulator transcription factor [Rheinheimera sp. A13L]EGM77761.1 response regulator with CheY-like receiver domain and winged-helix DNA-binding domain protein [Rheinheimera sp. A13L]
MNNGTEKTQPVRLLVLEDDTGLQSFLQTLLDSQGYQSLIHAQGKQGFALLKEHSFDLILLDLGLADMDGIQWLQQLRSWSEVPVIVISARGKELDKVQALDSGANDYVTKPFSSAELLARIRATLRQQQKTASPLAFANIKLDPVQRLVTKAGEPVHLTKTEYDILLLLVRHLGSALTHNQILQQVWGEHYQDRPEYIRVHMAQLRQKLEDTPSAPKHLKTEAGVGYRLCE